MNNTDRKLKDMQADLDYKDYQLEQYRQDEERHRQEREEQRQARRRQSQERLLYANNWHEAFRNNAIRLLEEADDDWFQTQYDINQSAQVIYTEEEQKAQDEIDAIMDRIRTNTIDRLKEKHGDDASMVIGFLEKDDPQGYVYW